MFFLDSKDFHLASYQIFQKDESSVTSEEFDMSDPTWISAEHHSALSDPNRPTSTERMHSPQITHKEEDGILSHLDSVYVISQWCYSSQADYMEVPEGAVLTCPSEASAMSCSLRSSPSGADGPSHQFRVTTVPAAVNSSIIRDLEKEKWRDRKTWW
ncbi:hypothetical protein AOLI_G00160910 [Acnodon oligacanthus]